MAIASLDLLLARLRGHFDAVFEQADALPSPATGQSNTEVALAGDLRALVLLNLGVTEAWSLRLAGSERHLLEGAALARDIGRPYGRARRHGGDAVTPPGRPPPPKTDPRVMMRPERLRAARPGCIAVYPCT
ncbi:hypothetical protein [Streptomyces sp. GESEQ-35]|uniref:hypothetical protein n=1 Tax=Streptomyces sp. GESEQ-35 TaxID=2812657 RepID=UPI001FF2F7BC|nr:hypothetical protein [Streptomyces sp. GESEQ-35]